MHLLTHKIVPSQLLDQRKHHRLYNQTRQIFELANTKVDVFYATVGKHPSIANKGQVDSLVTSLKDSHKTLHQKAVLAGEAASRSDIKDDDYHYIAGREKKVSIWLEKMTKIQLRLQQQIDAELWFRNEDMRKKADLAEVNAEYLKDKPLPFVSQPVTRHASQSKPKFISDKSFEAGDVYIIHEDEIDPIIDSYHRMRNAYEADGFATMPTFSKEWI